MIQPDGKLLIQGGSGYGPLEGGIRRLESDGSPDLNWTGGAYGGSLALQPDAKILTTINGNRIVRFKANGMADSTFNSALGINGAITGMTVQPDGQILIWGNFTEVLGVPRPGIARLNGERYFVRVSLPRSGPDDGIRLRINSQPGLAYRLEASDDLRGWRALGTNIATGFTLEFEDNEVIARAHRFYRAGVLP